MNMIALKDDKQQTIVREVWRLHTLREHQGADYVRTTVALAAEVRALRASYPHGKWLSAFETPGLLPFTSHRQAQRVLQEAEALEGGDEVPEKADVRQLAYVGAKPGTADRNAWYTPADIIARARAVLGTIDFDPFSSTEANKTVKARRFCTEEDDAFARKVWSKNPQDTIWMNPPYGASVINKAIDRFCMEWDVGNFSEGIVLVNNATDTAWANELWARASAVAFTRGRIGFVDADGKNVGSNTRGQMFFYFGGAVAKFDAVFKESCNVVPGRFA